MKSSIASFLAIAQIFAAIIPLRAQWTSVPELRGCLVNALAVKDGRVFVGTELHGVFRSTSNQADWQQVNNGIDSNGISSLAVSESYLFSGSTSCGAFRSANDGDGWTRIDTGLAYPYVYALHLDGSNLFLGLNRGVYLSTDYGTSWTFELNRWPGYASPPTVLCFTRKGSSLYAGTFREGFFVLSSDNRWYPSNSGLSDKYVNDLCTNGTTLFAGTYHGVFSSRNDGLTWSASNIGLSNTNIHSVIAFGPYVIAGTDEGVSVSCDTGATWVSANQGYSGRMVNCLLADNSFLYAGADDGLWKRPLSEITGLDDTQPLPPSDSKLGQNFPNPFNPTTTIPFCLDSRCHVTLRVYDLLGREITTLLSQELPSGNHYVKWNAEHLPSDMYIVRMQAALHSEARRLILLN